jgi:hypothetical protein
MADYVENGIGYRVLIYPLAPLQNPQSLPGEFPFPNTPKTTLECVVQ